jgi:hypothetical protein
MSTNQHPQAPKIEPIPVIKMVIVLRPPTQTHPQMELLVENIPKDPILALGMLEYAGVVVRQKVTGQSQMNEGRIVGARSMPFGIPKPGGKP